MKKNIAVEDKQAKKFVFTDENLIKVEKEIKKYPQDRKRSAVMALLNIAQEQSGGWISTVAMGEIANILKISPISVYEVASFYSMYNLAPIGKYLVQVCRTTPCWLCSSEDILSACKNFLGVNVGETTDDNMFTLIEVECLGACVNAPVVQINKKYYEKLTQKNIIDILSSLK